MQCNNIAGGRPRSRTYSSLPSTSYSKNPTKANLGGNEDDVDKLTTTRAIGYYDNSNVKFANQGEEENLVGVMDRLRAAKSRAKVDRNQETMRLRKDCWILESQRKAMLNSTVAFSNLLRSTRLKNARAAAQAGDADSASGTETPDGSPPMSPRLHTKLLRWRGISLASQEPDESSDGAKTPSTEIKNRLPDITHSTPSTRQHREGPGTTADKTESEIGEIGQGHGKALGVLDRHIASGNRRPRSQSLRRTLPSADEQRRQSPNEVGQAAENGLQAKVIMERGLLRRRPKTAAPKLASKSEIGEKDVKEKTGTAVEEAETLQDTSSAVGTPPSSRRRARSMSYMALSQNSISASGKVRAVNEKTISLHGRTTRELRKITHIDNVAAAESEERRKQIEERNKEIKERQRQVLQEKVDKFLKKLKDTTKEELDEKRSLYSGLTLSF
ncbi:uncharacterized protein LOC100891829 [Strongylocentrotus purpuratus]|uniref:Uncharacterized protein n=1 Tax=Strongylocentrotus purpuratus TaxID=7668 RepID=A0A7M7GMV4_STRPU|nr:uncharacterized protein LOC100891829 [Strongylocentrotus purpuratus]